MKTVVAINWKMLNKGMALLPSGYMLVVEEGVNQFELFRLMQEAAEKARSQDTPTQQSILNAIELAVAGKAKVEKLVTVIIDFDGKT